MTVSQLDLIPTLQTAVGPAILVSGTGLLLLTMTNRLGRTIDRARELAAQKAGDGGAKRQLGILWARARLLRTAILLSAASALCVALLVILLFLTALLKVDAPWLVVGFFVAGMLFLIGSLVLFIRDVNLSLGALQLELGESAPGIPPPL